MKKKALIFIEDGSFSYDNRVKREATALVDSGWDVTVVSPKYKDDPFFRELSSRLRSYHYPKPNAESALGHLFEHSISLSAGFLLTGLAGFRHGFSVFQACNPMDILWLIAAPYKVLGKKFIFDQHDLSPELYLSRKNSSSSDFFFKALQWLEKGSYRLADAVIATNESYKHTAISRGGHSQQSVFVVRNGPDLRRLHRVTPDPSLKRPGEILVGYLGNMNPQDGVDLLLQSAQVIRDTKQRSDIRFVLIGGGSSQESLQQESVDKGLSEIITFTGRIPDDDMLATLCACDICVQPDPKNPLNDVSTMNKVMEYMALEIPVVAFDLKETRVSCAEAALYAQENSVEDLADKILHLADNPELRRTMGCAGKKRVQEILAWKYSIPKLMDAYNFAMRK